LRKFLRSFALLHRQIQPALALRKPDKGEQFVLFLIVLISTNKNGGREGRKATKV
jgi:hypothetical protein